MFNERCPHCDSRLDQTGAVLNLARGKTHFWSWACRSCGTRVETRKIDFGPVEVLLVSQPKAVIDAALDDRVERESLGHAEFQVIRGRRNVRTIS